MSSFFGRRRASTQESHQDAEEQGHSVGGTRRGSAGASVSSSTRFVRKLVNRGANDYRAEATVPARVPRARAPAVPTIDEQRNIEGDNIDGTYNPDLDGQQQPGFWARCCDCCSADRRMVVFKTLLKSSLWKALIILCSTILLFGAQVRTLAFEEPADFAFDLLFCGIFLVFLWDIGMRIDVEPNYFAFDIGCCFPKREDNTAPVTARMEADSAWGNCNFQLGSFLFFCELASTLALLHEISFIHKGNWDEKEVNIHLDSAGIPVSGMDDVNESSPIEYQEYSLLFTVAKTARVARFIRSTTAMTLASKVNWYLIISLLNPLWWWNKMKHACADPAAATFDESQEVNLRNSSDGRNSWTKTALAAAQARVREDRRRNEETGIKGLAKRCLRCFGCMRRGDESWKRNLAATKIQRAWRRARYRHHDEIHEFDHSERDFAWKARSSTVSQNRAPSRSMLAQPQGSRNKAFSRASHRSPLAHAYNEKKKNESQVGSAMRELTGQRVAIGIILALVLTVLFTYTENNATRPATMIVLHNQTANELFANQSIQAARDSSAPDLFQYTFASGESFMYEPLDGESIDKLRDREILQITVTDASGAITEGRFSYRDESKQEAVVSLLSTVFIILVWFFGVTAFVGPVMVLVVIPIERMVRLLGMLTLDPLGYQSTSRYRKFVAEEDEITKNTRWTKEILRGMETSFLMLTILRIGSLMKVGFGSAGVEIIRNNLEKSQTKNTLILSEKGGTVSCIFLFCDIRQFTDATECLQEEVFVFTNRIAGVVHSICHAYGGSANKNIGDAFLLSWRLEEEDSAASTGFGGPGSGDTFVAKHSQADKALLSVVKITMALHHDDYYIETMSETAREALLAKLAKRKGPVVQLGFGLHAGKAVQGAIGSQRKIDATYVSEAVERAEFLESSTKKYGVKMLMSDNFHRLLHPNNRRRCRKIDQIMITNDDDDDDEVDGEIMELLTFDMDIDALWKNVNKGGTGSVIGKSDSGPESDHDSDRNLNAAKPPRKMPGSTRKMSDQRLKGRRISVRMPVKDPSDELSDQNFLPGIAVTSNNSNADLTGDGDHHRNDGPPVLSLPNGPQLYNASVWVSEDMRRVRQLYSDGIFFQKFNAGLNSYYSRDWEHARQCFVTILERFEDGPSRYFLTQIEKNNGKPPRNFRGYGMA